MATSRIQPNIISRHQAAAKGRAGLIKGVPKNKYDMQRPFHGSLSLIEISNGERNKEFFSIHNYTHTNTYLHARSDNIHMSEIRVLNTPLPVSTIAPLLLLETACVSGWICFRCLISAIKFEKRANPDSDNSPSL